MKTDLHKPVFFPHLDVVRFLSAFMIVIVHAYDAWVGWFGKLGIFTNGTYNEYSLFGGLMETMIHNFNIGVNIFFLLSGFLITYLLLKEKERNGTIDLKRFYIRRILRIWPLYFFLIAITPFLIHFLHESQPDYLSTVLFYNNFHTIQTHSWAYPFSHFWSICIEEHFYLIWPLVILFIGKRKLISTFVLLILLSISFRLYTCYTNPDAWYTLYLHTLSRIDVLIIGAIGAFYYNEHPFEFRLDKVTRIALYILFIVVMCIEKINGWDSTFLAAFKPYFYVGLIAILLLDYNFNPTFPHILKTNSIFHYFGKISYGIYLYSNILVLITIKAVKLIGITSPYLFFSLIIILSVGIPIISYELFEKPFLKFKSRFEVVKTR
jgi:peptidoglycan/LPS O-acetylase OafA/YrhL